MTAYSGFLRRSADPPRTDRRACHPECTPRAAAPGHGYPGEPCGNPVPPDLPGSEARKPAKIACLPTRRRKTVRASGLSRKSLLLAPSGASGQTEPEAIGMRVCGLGHPAFPPFFGKPLALRRQMLYNMQRASFRRSDLDASFERFALRLPVRAFARG